MKILFLPIGGVNRASSRFRVYNLLDLLPAEGHDIAVKAYYKIISSNQTLNRVLSRLRLFFYYYPFLYFAANRYKVIYVQESLIPTWATKRFVRQNCKLIFDFSDPLDIHYKAGEPEKASWLDKLMLKRFYCLAGHARQVLVENSNYVDSLSAYNKNIKVIGGPVDQRLFDGLLEGKNNGVKKDTTVIGWTGSPHTLKFIEPLFSIIDRLGKHKKIELWLVGCGTRNFDLKNVEVKIFPWSIATESNLVSQFDLGLFYLEKTPNNEMRGGGKLFVYMAAQIAIVASEVGIARQVLGSEHNIGTLVNNDPDEWEKALERYVTDDTLRKAHGLAGRKKFEETYAIQSKMKFYEELLFHH